MEADDLNLNPNLQGKKGAEHYSEAWSSNTVESQFSKPRISSAGQVLLQSLALTENQLTSAGGSQCRVSVPADALGLGLQSWVLTVAWQHGRFLTSFETNIWLAVVPKLCGAAECFCSREAAVWQRQRSHIFSHRSPPPPPPPPLFFSKTVFFFYICATASCLLHGHPLGLQWFSAEYGTIPPPHTHTHIYSLTLSLCLQLKVWFKAEAQSAFQDEENSVRGDGRGIKQTAGTSDWETKGKRLWH